MTGGKPTWPGRGGSGVEQEERVASRLSQRTQDSALVLDVDRVAARALLFDMVEGVPRFVAAAVATAGPTPEGDPAAAIPWVLRDLEEQTGRALLEGEELITPQRPNGDGIDTVYLTGLPVPPIRVAVVALGESHLARLVAAAARRTMTVVAEAARDLAGESGGLSAVAVQEWLRLADPEVVVLVGGGAGAEDWTVALDAIGDAARDGVLRQGIVIADAARQQEAAAALGTVLELSGIAPDEAAATEIAAALEGELRGAYLRRVREAEGPRLLASAAVVDRPVAVQAVAAFLNRRMGRNVVAVVSSEGTVLQAAVGGRGAALHRAEWDLSTGVRSLMQIPADQVVRWLPMRASLDEVADWILNRALRPHTALEARADRVTAAALYRELLARAMREAGLGDQPDVDLIAAGPCLVAGDPVLTLLALLDGVQPDPASGVVSIGVDLEGLMAAVGALATGDPAYAREVAEQDLLAPLASCVTITGTAPEGVLAVRGELRRPSGESTRFSVPVGSLHRLPIGEGEAGTLVLEPEPGFAVGRRAAGAPVHLEVDRDIFGGELGIIIDARGRPVTLPDDPAARVARLTAWLTDLGMPAEG